MNAAQPTQAEIEQDIRLSITQTGKLYQSGPNIGDWMPTRVGVDYDEVVAFTNKRASFHRLYLRIIEPGETDEDDVLYEDGAHIVETQDPTEEYLWEERYHDSLDAALEDMAEIMIHVTETRE